MPAQLAGNNTALLVNLDAAAPPDSIAAAALRFDFPAIRKHPIEVIQHVIGNLLGQH